MFAAPAFAYRRYRHASCIACALLLMRDAATLSLRYAACRASAIIYAMPYSHALYAARWIRLR